jgi:NTP pyrophosphatase (non-canonical NTP hydrolase)
MNLKALQTTLRAFAAERQWEPFHTPKNLAMAMMVEAAEVVELFQWLTPEESCAARDNPALQMRIGEELSDVLLYLLQLADHTGVDLQLAVQDKLLKNAVKHPVPDGLRPL